MGRSTETFGKKEKEKARLKKAKDKKERAEERKANAGTGKSLEDMMAYIDEHGNITSTPPDPSRKLKVNSEDIQIGIAKRQDLPHDTVRNGVVSFFNEAKGYGFIRDLQTEESIFVHINALTGPIKENNLVTFETEQGQKGLSAINVKIK
ncbi:cold-shock DNA-binding protein family [Mucilaginibacter sp. OK268]|uniref:cold-shock protein n=1 Tax=Mucilaginibacter sp. OK268 TaxID=1881048 RepID=UPI00087FE5EA|nr:cold shock domain-containing protein [Mucilaginibacter sp. OK268]SDP86500.1 cold-shock DNA-binding protein family [Mucilaginibacter sp. OK268]